MTLRSLFTAGALVTIGMLASRLFGLLREMLLASRFGVGSQADLAIAFLVIPDFVTSAFIGNAVSATLVPLFMARSRENALLLFWQAIFVSLGVFVLIAFLIGLNEHSIISLVTHDAAMIPAAAVALRIALCAIPLTATTAIIIAYLQYCGRFIVPAFANAIFNGVIVLMLWLMPAGVVMVAVSILLGVLVRLSAHIIVFYRLHRQLPQRLFHPWQLDKAIAKTYGATVGTDIFSLFPQFATYYVVAATGSGLAVFNYSLRLSIVPAMIASSVTQLVLLPWFARLVQQLDGEDRKIPPYVLTLQCAFALSLAVCLSLSLASRDIAVLCFGYGKMNAGDLDEIARLFTLGVWAMPGIVLASIWQQIMYAHGRPRLPLFASGIQAAAIIPLCWAGMSLAGLQGVMLAYVCLPLISIMLISYGGWRQGLIAHYHPSAIYVKMLLAALAAWLPLRWLLMKLALPAAGKLLLSLAIGLIVLAAALSVCHPVRQWALKHIKPL